MVQHASVVVAFGIDPQVDPLACTIRGKDGSRVAQPGKPARGPGGGLVEAGSAKEWKGTRTCCDTWLAALDACATIRVVD